MGSTTRLRAAALASGLLVLTALAAPSARADIYTWIHFDGDWSDGANWDRGAPPGAGDTASFKSSVAVRLTGDTPIGFIANEASVLLAGGRLIFSGAAPAIVQQGYESDLRISSAIHLALAAPAAELEVRAQGVRTHISLDGPIDGVGGLRLSPSQDSTIAVRAANGYSGATSIAGGGGGVIASADAAFATGPIELWSRLRLLGVSLPNALVGAAGQLVGDGSVAGPVSGSLDIAAIAGGTHVRIGELDGASVHVGGSLEIERGTAGSLVVDGRLAGDVTAAALTVGSAGGHAPVVAPGLPIGTLTTTGSLALDAATTLAIDLRGWDGDRLIVGASATSASLGGAALVVQALADVDPRASFVIVDNRRPPEEKILGTFAGLPEGAAVTVGGATFTITYAGGDGNDIALLGTVTCTGGDPDGDGQPDDCDADDDGDGVDDQADDCPSVYDPEQGDTDGDHAGDVCDDDDDGDGTADGADDCPYVAAPQLDSDGDGVGDACDDDVDGDGLADDVDVCPGEPDADQLDTDGDGAGDACDGDDDGDGALDDADTCPTVANADQAELDGDGLGDACDADDDGDGVLDAADACPSVADADQLDIDGDGAGDACDLDDDGDGHDDDADNCPRTVNLFQLDLDGDGLGDACDADDDGDGIDDDRDNCAFTANPYQLDLDLDGRGDACDGDDDGDGVADQLDLCPLAPDAAQADLDGDGSGDACDDDDDADGVPDVTDDCARIPDPEQVDSDHDGAGDACDADDDGDGVPDDSDGCPLAADAGQGDLDGDGLGDACDPDADGDGVAGGADLCPRTPAGALVDPTRGCSLAELCPCSGPRGASIGWRNHGALASCVAHTAQDLRRQGLLTEAGDPDAVAATLAACR